MKLFRKALTIIAIITLFGQTAFAQSISQKDFSKAQVTIKYFDRTIYYPGESEANPVQIHVTIKNNGTETLRFKLADDKAFSMDFQVYTVKNNILPQTERIIEKRTTNQTVYFREIALEYGEEYSFVENLKDFVDIKDPSVYYVELSFYPELFKSKYIELTSNRLTLEVRPAPNAVSSTYIPVESKTSAILTPQEISPDKVVEQTIIARQKSLWDQFFLYMDVESLLKKNKSLKQKYNTASAEERERMLDAFKADMMQSRYDNDIIAIPEKFEIVKTSYSPVEGTVLVTEWFKYPNFYEKKNYTYKVRQYEGIWQIYDYTVVNLGTE